MTRVLVVDDHRLVRVGLITLLQAAGDIEVVGGGRGRQALEVARASRSAVTLMDLSMPVLDCVEVIRFLLQEWPDARVVALTSFSDGRGSSRGQPRDFVSIRSQAAHLVRPVTALSQRTASLQTRLLNI